MVRLGLIGDTQGRYRVDALLRAVEPHFRGVDEVWHAGDWQSRDVLEGLTRFGKPLVVVNGNAPDDDAFPAHVVRQVEGVKIGMTHYPPRGDEAWLAGCRIVIHGHTHRWRDEVVDGVRYVNVSTPTAAGFSRDRTVGVLTVDGTRVDLTRVNLSV
jgi:putative phosphoesterase